MRLYSLIPAALLLAVSTLAAHADSIYAFTLTPTSGGGNVSGTLLLTLQTAIPTAGSFYAQQNEAVGAYTTNVLGLSITMSDGATFSLAQENGLANATFFNDSLLNFSYDDNNYPIEPLIGIGGTHYDFSTNGNYSGSTYTGGTISFDGLAAAATPEPSSIALLGTGLLGFAGLMRKRFV